MNSKFVEIMQTIAGKTTLSNDFAAVMGAINNLFSEKYLTPISAAIKETYDIVEKNPSREVALIQSMRSLVGANNQLKIDEAINLLNQIEVLRIIAEQLDSASCSVNPTVNAACVHNDGVYEIDEQCVRRKANPNMNDIFIMMLLINSGV